MHDIGPVADDVDGGVVKHHPALWVGQQYERVVVAAVEADHAAQPELVHGMLGRPLVHLRDFHHLQNSKSVLRRMNSSNEPWECKVLP